jgi:hypothetical protein
MQHLSRHAIHDGAVDAAMFIPVCTSLNTAAGSFGLSYIIDLRQQTVDHDLPVTYGGRPAPQGRQVLPL